MRILHVVDSYLPTIGGIEVMVEQFTRRQRSRGDQVRVLTRARGTQLEGVCRDPRRLAELVGWAEVVHVHLSMVSPLGFTALRHAARTGRPTIASVHSMWTHGEPAMALGGRLAGWRALPVVWAPVSQAAAGPVRECLAPGAEVVVLPNAVDLDFWHPRQQTGQPAAGGTGRPITLVSVGRMAPRKRPLAIVAMLAAVRERVPQQVALRAVLAGEGELRLPVLQRVKALGMADWVEVPGALDADQVRQLNAEADIHVAASRLESFGLAALEARVSGLAVVARTGTGIADFVADQGPGLLADDDEQMVAALVELCTNPARLRSIQARHLSTPPELGWENLLAGTDALYRRAAELQGSSLPGPGHQRRTVVALHAHPDDETLITGGTLAGLSAAGHRVVLVTATDGAAGLADEGFGHGEHLAAVRGRELDRAAAALGIERVVRLGHRDSGSDRAHLDPQGFCFTDVDEVAERVARIVREEGADLLIGYDAAGGYGHPDHVQVHHVGRRAAELSGVAGYLEATVERAQLQRAVRLLKAVPVARRLVPADGFRSSWTATTMSATVDVTPWVGAKRRALKAHASQATGGGIRTVALLSHLRGPVARRVLGTEWFTGPGPVARSQGRPSILLPPALSEPCARQG